ncbi:hypothetical protein O181_032971 [Austropuccinia psidii MF-1]|uniref:Uncharacterized protein n=1 Tax=Austropuccinia psidii MF-1 TaxID=1389203 RepID=A0A9Q3H6M6_9BASI|nr:hypothetical protein [Austropuccinia psidii MF-1]
MAQKIEALVPTFTACTNAIGCMAHTIHLAARDGLNALAQGPPVATNDPKGNMNGPMSISHILDLPDCVNTSYNSIINQISRLSSYIRQSPQRREKFIGTVNLIYDEANTLLSNICTRWNSTYGMLQQSLALKDACIQYCSTDSMHAYCLSKLKWEKVLVMVNFLQPLYEATHIVSGSTYPTIKKTLPLYISLIKRIHQVHHSQIAFISLRTLLIFQFQKACDQYEVTN